MKFATRAAAAALLWLSTIGAASAEALMKDFEDRQVASSISFPVDLTFLSDDRMLVAQKEGKLLIYDSNGGDSYINRKTLLDLTDIVCENGERGLGAVQVHPKYDQGEQYIYVYFTYKKFGNCLEDGDKGPVNRLSRFWLDKGATKIDRNTEKVLFDTPPLEHRYQ